MQIIPWWRRTTLLLCLIVTAQAWAYRREYKVTLDGVPKGGSEVCFYRATSVRDAFTLYFSHDRVGCLPADKVLDLPSGIFHVFARHLDGYASGYPDFFVKDGPPAPERGYQLLEIPLEPAGVADFSDVMRSLKRGERAGVWLAATPEHAGTYVPVVDGESVVMVPAERPFVALVIGDGVPRAIGEPMTVSSGRRAMVRFGAPSRNHTDLVTWAKVDLSGVRHGLHLARAEVTAVAGDVTVPAMFPLEGGLDATQSLVFFKNVPVGNVELVTRGKTWIHSQKDVDAGSGPVTAIRDPLLLIPAAALTVTWDTGAGESSEEEGCNVRSEPRPNMTATVVRCPADPKVSVPCTAVARLEERFAARGSFEFEGVEPGAYTVIVAPPFRKAVTARTELTLGAQETIAVQIPAFRFFGQVTLNGDPLEARLVFESGEANSDASGHYAATLAANPLTNAIEVVPCDGGHTIRFLPSRPVFENEPFDIALSDRAVIVTVVTDRGAPVEGASVTFSPLKNGSAAYYTSPPELTDRAGQATLHGAPSDKRLDICAEHTAHARTCAPAVDAGSAPAEVKVTFPAVLLRGRVAGHHGDAVLAWVNPAGQVTEEVRLLDDGRFALLQAHGREEYLVYVSRTAPLTVMPQPETADGSEMLVNLPQAPVRSCAVTVAGRSSGFVGLWVGQRYVPLELLVSHHDWRGVDILVSAERPVRLTDIAELAPLRIAYAPEPPPTGGGFVDPFTVPPFMNAERFLVTANQLVINPR